MPVSVENMKAEHWTAIFDVADEAAAARWADDGKPRTTSRVRQKIQKLRPTKDELAPLAEVIDRFDLDRRVAVRQFVSRFRTSYACKLLSFD
jgi:hypothetical protein